MHTFEKVFAATLALVGLAGCGGGSIGPEMVVVAGQVVFDGQPLETGSISFIPSDGQGPTAGAEIVKGQYKTSVTPGPKRVEIRSTKVVGQRKTYEDMPDSPTVDVVEELIPPRYNAESDLQHSVAKGKSAAVNFKLDAAPPH